MDASSPPTEHTEPLDVQLCPSFTRMSSPVSSSALPSPSQGIILHVDKCGDKPPHSLSFRSACSACINIGRKSASDDRSMRRENDDHNAVFACQVVSARHAKLIFSDGGQVYIVDLHSRHGTHLLRHGETATRMLQPDVETLLADGDVLTFGKVVGAGSFHVSPVTARVELISGCSSPVPCAVRALTPFDPPTPVLSRPRKLSSGRYGLISEVASCAESSDSPHSSFSISSDISSSASEQGSDADEEHACISSVFRDSHCKTSVRIPAFRSIIREFYHNTVSPSPAFSDVPLEGPHSEAAIADVVRQPSPVIIVETFSNSPPHSSLGVVSPSPSPSCEAQQPEPAVVGAWPASRPESPRYSSLEVEAGRSEVVPALELEREPESVTAQPSTCQTRIAPISNDAFVEFIHRLPPSPFFPIGGPFSNSITSDFGLPSVPPQPLPPPPPPQRMSPFHPLHKAVTECVSSEIKRSLSSVEDRITTLQETVGDLKSRQTVTEEDVVDLQGNVETLEPDTERLLCRITGAERNIATLSMLQGQMTALQNQVTMLRGRLDTLEAKPVDTPMDDIRACAEALNNLVSEMRSLREDVERRIESKMKAIQNARVGAFHALRKVVAEAESVRCSKRKREDEAEAEETSGAVSSVGAVAEPDICSPLVDESGATVAQVPVTQVTVSAPDVLVSPVNAPALEPARPKKRARTVMYSVARTAAVMAVGAAATWSALAFS